MTYPPGPEDPYGPGPYGHPPQSQSLHHDRRARSDQAPYGYPYQDYGPNTAIGYGGPAAYGTIQANNGLINIPYLGVVPIASMGQRFLARLLDFFVTGLVIAIALIAGLAGSLSAEESGSVRDARLVALFFTFVMTLSAFALLYEWLMIAFLGATLGKLALGLKVVKEHDGGTPGLGASFVRYVIPIIGTLLCYVGIALVYVSPFFDNTGKSQGWHDRAAGTVVIKR